MSTQRTPDRYFQLAVDHALAEVNRMAIDEARAIDACDHSRATVEDRDEATDREGKTIGVREYMDCPDCPLSDWFDVDATKENA